MLSVSCWWVFEFNNEFVFPDPRPAIIDILYGWLGTGGQFRLRYFMFSFITPWRLIIFCIA